MPKSISGQPWRFDTAGQMEGYDSANTFHTWGTFTAATTDIATMTAHNFVTGQGPVQVSTSGTLPTGLAASTNYWIEVINANTFYFHSTEQGARDSSSATQIDITGTGSGTHTLSMKNVFNHSIYINRLKVETGDADADFDLLDISSGRQIAYAASGDMVLNNVLEWPIDAFVSGIYVNAMPTNGVVYVYHGPPFR